MSRRAPALTARAWLGAAAGSMVIHALAVLALIQGGAVASDAGPGLGAPGRAPDPLLGLQADWVDILPLTDPPPTHAAPPQDQAIEPPRPDVPERDQDRRPAQAVAPRVAEGLEPRAPAADDGQRAGRTADVAWRRDRSTLNARLTNGASVSQPSRFDSGARTASPQAQRREPIVGMGDAARTQRDATPPSAPQHAPPDESAVADSSLSAAGTQPAQPIIANQDDRPQRVETVASDRGIGPLDAEPGPRSVDSESRGAPGDNRDRRAASHEMRPGITDFSRAGVRSRDDSLSGLGPGQSPGAVDRAAGGRAPAEYGASSVQRVSDEVSEPTQDRRYQLYIQEIARRVNSVREFPKRLALRLEQGETVVRFVLEKDGRIRNGVQVMKSSGFDEFDSAAAHAVERAAPFPPMPAALAAHPLTVSVRVAFENPLVR